MRNGEEHGRNSSHFGNIWKLVTNRAVYNRLQAIHTILENEKFWCGSDERAALTAAAVCACVCVLITRGHVPRSLFRIYESKCEMPTGCARSALVVGRAGLDRFRFR